VLASLLFIFVFNLFIEIAIASSLGYRRKDELVAILLVNLLTNPLLNYILWFGVTSTLTGKLSLEIIVIVVEAYAIGFSLRKAPKNYLLLSLLMNTASLGSGLILGAVYF
jgi:hypothetical protein